jgi:hypothetical protein
MQREKLRERDLVQREATALGCVPQSYVHELDLRQPRLPNRRIREIVERDAIAESGEAVVVLRGETGSEESAHRAVAQVGCLPRERHVPRGLGRAIVDRAHDAR